MKTKGFEVAIEKDTDGTYIAYNTNCTKCTLIGRGATATEAKADFENTMRESINAYKDAGLEVPKELEGTPIYRFSIASLFEYYSMINVSAFARMIGINETLMRQYRTGKTYISDQQLRKIEDGIHAIGQELSNLRLT